MFYDYNICIILGLDVPTLKELNSHVRLEAATKRHDLAIELLSAKKVDIIYHKYGRDVETCCTEMFKLWLKEDPEANWVKIVSALRSPSVKLHSLANEIERNFIDRKLCGYTCHSCNHNKL